MGKQKINISEKVKNISKKIKPTKSNIQRVQNTSLKIREKKNKSEKVKSNSLKINQKRSKSEKVFIIDKNVIIGARQQHPYTNLPILKTPIFPKISENAIIQLKENKTSNFVGKIDTDIAISILLKLAPKNFKDIFGFSLDDEEDSEDVEEKKGKKKRKKENDIRKMLEPLNANDQCIRSNIKFKLGETVCWLCGCTINEGSVKKACEHIIPALRAVMLKGLVTNKEITETIYNNTNDFEIYKTMTQNNYLWAHANCNGMSGKTNIVLIDYDKEKNKFIPDFVNCALLDSKIRKLPKRNCYYTLKNGIDYTGNNNIVRSPYETYITEMEYQCLSINDEFSFFNNDLSSFCEYALNRAKLFMTEKGILGMMSHEDKEKMIIENEEKEQLILKSEYEELNKLYDKIKEDTRLASNYFNKNLPVIKEFNKLYDLIKEDTRLKNDYLSKNLSSIKANYKNENLSFKQKKAYYNQVIQFYLNFYNINSADNNSLEENIMNKLDNESGKYLIDNIPLDIMLTIICILTQIVIFFSPDGHKDLLITKKFINVDQRTKLTIPIERFKTGRKVKGRVLDKNLFKYLFILGDGTPDNDRFQNHICDFLSIFFVQCIIYDIKKSGNTNITNLSNEVKLSDEIQPIPVSINTELLSIIKKKIHDLPKYIEKYTDKYLKEDSEIYKSLNVIFFSITSKEISFCMDTIKNKIKERFINPGATLISTLNPKTGLEEIREANPEGYNSKIMGIIQNFEDYINKPNINSNSLPNYINSYNNKLKSEDKLNKETIEKILSYYNKRNSDSNTTPLDESPTDEKIEI
jgi:hypothetical protein